MQTQTIDDSRTQQLAATLRYHDNAGADIAFFGVTKIRKKDAQELYDCPLPQGDRESLRVY